MAQGISKTVYDAGGYSPRNDGTINYSNQVSGAQPTTANTTINGGGRRGYISPEVGPELIKHPEDLANILRQQRGLTGPNRGGKYARYADEVYGKALSLLAQLGPDLLGGSIEDIINQAAQNINNGSGIGGMLHTAGQSAMTGFDPMQGTSDQAMNQIARISAALGYGQGPWEQAQTDLMDNTLNSDYTNYDVSGKEDYFKSHPIGGNDYWKRLQALAAQYGGGR